MRVNAWDASIFYALRKWAEPTFRFPLEGIVTPNPLVNIDSPEIYEDLGILRHWDLRQQGPIDATDGLREG